MLSEWGPSCFWKFPLKTMTQENCLGNLHMRYLLNYDWVTVQYYTSTIYEWTLIDTLQSDTFSRMLSHCWIHIRVAVKPPSQSVLIDYIFGVLSLNTFKLQRKSNRHVVYSKTLSRACSYHNISPFSLAESCGPRTSIEQNKCYVF